MTEEQKEQILLFRNEGLGYKAIGNRIGLSRDVVRNYCKRHGYNGYGDSIAHTLKDDGGCKMCGAALLQNKTGRPRKFCCEEHRRLWWKRHPEKIKKTAKAEYSLVCQQCGKVFISYGNKNRIYCGRECYFRHRFLLETEE